MNALISGAWNGQALGPSTVTCDQSTLATG